MNLRRKTSSMFHAESNVKITEAGKHKSDNTIEMNMVSVNRAN